MCFSKPCHKCHPPSTCTWKANSKLGANIDMWMSLSMSTPTWTATRTRQRQRQRQHNVNPLDVFQITWGSTTKELKGVTRKIILEPMTATSLSFYKVQFSLYYVRATWIMNLQPTKKIEIIEWGLVSLNGDWHGLLWDCRLHVIVMASKRKLVILL